jgi:hypothetical protein
MNKHGKTIIILCIFLCVFFLKGQISTCYHKNYKNIDYSSYSFNEDIDSFNTIFTIVQQPPFWEKNVYVYLDSCVRKQFSFQCVNARLIITFVVYSNGKPKCQSVNISSKDSINAGFFRNSINSMPYWHPGKQRNHKLNCKKTIAFIIENGHVIKDD